MTHQIVYIKKFSGNQPLRYTNVIFNDLAELQGLKLWSRDCSTASRHQKVAGRAAQYPNPVAYHVCRWL